ncbi:MAG: VOC family protein [Planctomycetota bacterium]
MQFRIGEINIICTDLERSLHFYRDLLGCEALKPEGPAWHLACDGRRFLLLGVAEQGRVPSGYCEVAEFSLDLLVDSLAEARARFEAAGVQFVSEFEPSAERFFIRDPDGLVLEIIQSTDNG